MFRVVIVIASFAFLVCPAVAAERQDYRIVGEVAGDAGRVLSIRIDGRISEADVQRLAQSVAAKRGADNMPSEIRVFLPGMALGAAPWAMVSVGDTFVVSILGLRLDEEEAFRARASNDARSVIGTWLTSAPALAGKLTIYRAGDKKLYAEWLLRSGTSTIDELEAYQVTRGRRFDIVGGDGNYYLALGNGALELGQGRSVIAIAERLAVEPRPVSQAPKLDGRLALGAATIAASQSQIGMDADLAGGLPRLKKSWKARVVRAVPRSPQRFVVRPDAVTTGDAISAALSNR